MNDEQRSLLLELSSRFSPPQGVKLSYGTAGFRADASLLESTVYRVGILAALRSLKTGAVTGLMITASHNQISDNGVKVADPSGGMLTQHWEPFADSIANAPDSSSLVQLIEAFVKKENILLDGKDVAEVLLGRDTRPSGSSLLEAAKQGVASIARATAVDMGVVTTPQLHWMVRAKNKCMEASEPNYYAQLSGSFRCLLELVPQGSLTSSTDDKLVVDGSDGVGGEKLETLKSMLNDTTIEVRNSGNGVLNDGVGADYVQKEKVVPRGFDTADVGLRCASLDGDADRLVYFFLEPNNTRIQLVDGDKIMALFALFIQEQLSVLNKNEDLTVSRSHQARIGVVQTAYANGASTQYLKHLGLEVVFTPTGVKHLHEKAAEFDIGIYFEANGHGTILFSETYISCLEDMNNDLQSTSRGSERHKAASRLLSVGKLINQAVGDALSGLLLVEAILKHFGWSIHRWNELYHDLPSRQLKVKVADRYAVVTANAETVVVKPLGLQEVIDAEIGKYYHFVLSL
ncbi:OLC1v1031451C2 [Oldenlandia corymbosa var. corymbosa]|uniref:Phosphoacetylglucosamine mutase n=1 Tax=Oldenlandia corymbosa var. corymbosa TaxID=529605 RepID=A0AAV1CIL1_OLDCO|nr:OLC1v1031451C2 [Oldenlandia corymbosa var. corymbosa]